MSAGEFVLTEWKNAVLNVATAVKRGIFTIKETLVRKRIGKLEDADAEELEKSLQAWLGCPKLFENNAVPRHREINEFLAAKICKDLEIPKP